MNKKSKKMRSVTEIQNSSLSAADQQMIKGGNIAPVGPIKVTWKYLKSTPAWAVQNAINAGYDVELID